MSPPQTPRRDGREKGQGGFTLIEVLISLFIFSMISTGTYLALASTLDAREASEARIAQVERLAAARRLLADDVATAVARSNRDVLGDVETPERTSVEPDRLELSRRARPNPYGTFARGDLLRVSWHVEGGQLIRSFLPHENPAQLSAPVARVVLDGVEAMEVRRVLSDAVLAQVAERAAAFDPAAQVTLADLTGPNGQGEASEIGVIDVTLRHADGTTTRHMFEWSPL